MFLNCTTSSALKYININNILQVVQLFTSKNNLFTNSIQCEKGKKCHSHSNETVEDLKMGETVPPYLSHHRVPVRVRVRETVWVLLEC